MRRPAEKLRTFEGHRQLLSRGVAFSPDGKRLASTCKDGTVKVWDAENSEDPRTLHGNRNASLAFSPDGKGLATAAADRTVKVWDAETGQELLTLKGSTGSVKAVAFSPDGKRLATGSSTGPADSPAK